MLAIPPDILTTKSAYTQNACYNTYHSHHKACIHSECLLYHLTFSPQSLHTLRMLAIPPTILTTKHAYTQNACYTTCHSHHKVCIHSKYLLYYLPFSPQSLPTLRMLAIPPAILTTKSAYTQNACYITCHSRHKACLQSECLLYHLTFSPQNRPHLQQNVDCFQFVSHRCMICDFFLD